MEAETCSVRLCRKTAVAKSPITCQPLCDVHIETDLSKVKKAELAVADRIEHFMKYRDPLRLMQQRLASDLQLLDDTFQELRDTLDKYQKELVDVITKQHDQLLDSMKVLAEMDNFCRDLKSAKEKNDERQAFLLNESMEKFLETLALDSNLVHMDDEADEVRIVAYPDINARFKEWEKSIKIEMRIARNVIDSLNFNDTEHGNLALVLESKQEFNVNGEAVCITVCSNTSGFGIRASDRTIMKIIDANDLDLLPEPCIIVAVHQASEKADEQTGLCEKVEKSVIRLVFPGSTVSATITCTWDAYQPIIDLYFDEDLQLLFIAQKQAVTVCDLSGSLRSRTEASSIQEDVKSLYCVTGNSDKWFVLAKLFTDRHMVFGISKKSGEVQLRLQVPEECGPICNPNPNLSHPKILARDRTLVIVTWVGWFTICTITGKHIGEIEIDSDFWEWKENKDNNPFRLWIELAENRYSYCKVSHVNSNSVYIKTYNLLQQNDEDSDSNDLSIFRDQESSSKAEKENVMIHL